MVTKTQTNENTDPVQGANAERHESEELVATNPEIVVVEGADAVAYADQLAFMNEKVEVMILESYDEKDTTRLVRLGVNGKKYNFLRGVWTTVPRYVLEMLARLKKESWTFSYKKNADGSTSDKDQMHRILRYPHQFRDKNPKGLAWYDSIKDAHF